MGHQGYGLAREWAQGVKDHMREMGCAGEPLAVDRLDGNGFRALADLDVEVTDPTPATVDAREVKTLQEVKLMPVNGTIDDAMMADFEAVVRPGIREHELMAVLNESLLRLHGEFMFTRVIATGANTNPWMSTPERARDGCGRTDALAGVHARIRLRRRRASTGAPDRRTPPAPSPPPTPRDPADGSTCRPAAGRARGEAPEPGDGRARRHRPRSDRGTAAAPPTPRPQDRDDVDRPHPRPPRRRPLRDPPAPLHRRERRARAPAPRVAVRPEAGRADVPRDGPRPRPGREVRGPEPAGAGSAPTPPPTGRRRCRSGSRARCAQTTSSSRRTARTRRSCGAA